MFSKHGFHNIPKIIIFIEQTKEHTIYGKCTCEMFWAMTIPRNGSGAGYVEEILKFFFFKVQYLLIGKVNDFPCICPSNSSAISWKL